MLTKSGGTISLNPCFSGTYSQSEEACWAAYQECVLILVLVEHTLRDKVVGPKDGLMKS